jgi:hypothetical protein
MKTHQDILKDVSLDAPWELVELFSKTPRWKPRDVNKSADMIVARLKKHGVPVKVYEPEIYLSVPFEASVKVGKTVIRAKPPAYSKSTESRAGLRAGSLFSLDWHAVSQEPARYRPGVFSRQDRNFRGVCVSGKNSGIRTGRSSGRHRR